MQKKTNKPIRKKIKAAVAKRAAATSTPEPKSEPVTLRDRFAIAALQMFHHQVNVPAQEVAQMAWGYADAMLLTQKPQAAEEPQTAIT